MRKHAPQLAELIEKQRSEHERYYREYHQKLASREREKEKPCSAEKYLQLKTTSYESITSTASFLAFKFSRDSEEDEVLGCFGKTVERSSKATVSPTRRRQALLDPIRRWNSFHSRDKKSNPRVVEQFEKFQKECAKEISEAKAMSVEASLPENEQGASKAKHLLAAELAHCEKPRSLSQGNVTETLNHDKKSSGARLMRQVTKELLLREKERKRSERSEDEESKAGGTFFYKRWPEDGEEMECGSSANRRSMRRKTRTRSLSNETGKRSEVDEDDVGQPYRVFASSASEPEDDSESQW